MPEYNFRVRAVDTAGAFADRRFSINVRNTVGERLLALDGTHAYSSSDGVNWTIRNNQGVAAMDAANPGRKAAVYGNGIWLIDRTATNGALSWRASTDGINWNLLTQSSFSRSSDGLSITSSAFATGGSWRAGMEFVNNKFVTSMLSTGSTGGTVPSNSNLILVSDDGVNWTINNLATFNTGSAALLIHPIAFGNGTYVVGSRPANNAQTSSIGWRLTDPLGPATQIIADGLSGSWNITDVLFVGGTWFFVDGASSPGRIFTSTNLTGFTARPVGSLPAACTLDRIFYANGRLLLTTRRLAGQTGTLNTVYTSDNGGVTWTARTMPALSENGTFAIGMFGGYANGVFYFGSANQTVGYRVSRDLGDTWQTVASGTNGAPGVVTGFAASR